MRVALVASVVPWPMDRGDPLRVATAMHLLTEEARTRDWECEIFVAAGDGADQAGPALEARVGAPVHVHPRRHAARMAKAERGARWLAGLVTARPTWVTERFSPSLFHALREHRPSLTFLFGEASGVYATAVPGSLRVWDKSNVLGASARSFNAGRPVRAAVTTHVSTAYERLVLGQIERVIVTSDAEAHRLASLYGRSADAIVPSVVPGEQLLEVTRQPQPRSVAWLSSVDYAPNSRGLEQFLDEAWPTLREAGWTLGVAGSGVPPRSLLDRLQRDAAVRYYGYVGDVHHWLSRHAVAVVPLWSGAGVKLKSLTLLAAAIPTIGTSIAFEGIPVVDSVHALLEDEPSQFARRISRFSQLDAEQQEALGERGRELVRQHFSESVMRDAYRHFLTRLEFGVVR